MEPSFGIPKLITKDTDRESNTRPHGAVGTALNLNEEYMSALRTKSFADFFIKAQSLVLNQYPSVSSPSRAALILLDPGQEASVAALQSALLSRNPDLKALILDYFDISAEASRICSHLLATVKGIESYNLSFRHELDTIGDGYSPDAAGQISAIQSMLASFGMLNGDFDLIRERHSALLRRLRWKSKQVARKIRLIRVAARAGEVAVTAACGVASAAAMVLGAHTLVGLLVGPAIMGIPAKAAMGKWGLAAAEYFLRVWEQLDAAAKGAYILKRDFDTVSRVLVRVRDEMEHSKAVVEMCLRDRKEGMIIVRCFVVEADVVKELRKSDEGLRQQVEELEEHLCLCLVTINRARALVLQEMMVSASVLA